MEKVIKSIWSFYGLIILHFAAKKMTYMQQLDFVGENIVHILDVKTTFLQIKIETKSITPKRSI